VSESTWTSILVVVAAGVPRRRGDRRDEVGATTAFDREGVAADYATVLNQKPRGLLLTLAQP
jgi:hypothetical protein